MQSFAQFGSPDWCHHISMVEILERVPTIVNWYGNYMGMADEDAAVT